MIDNHGLIDWQGGGAIRTRDQSGAPARINNHPGGVFRLSGDGELFTTLFGNLVPVFHNLTGARIERAVSVGLVTWRRATLYNSSDFFLQTGTDKLPSPPSEPGRAPSPGRRASTTERSGSRRAPPRGSREEGRSTSTTTPHSSTRVR